MEQGAANRKSWTKGPREDIYSSVASVSSCSFIHIKMLKGYHGKLKNDTKKSDGEIFTWIPDL
jgi:hypothetical protein